MTAPLNWHFPRVELAEKLMDRFQIGATTALTLFAPRRMGKTEFVNKDLLPLAEKQGYITAYVNFWDRKQNPADSLIVGLTRATGSLKRTAKLRSMLGRITGGSISTPIGGAGFTLEDKGEADKLDIIQQLFDLLLKDGRPLLLALDEVQHLATDRKFEPIIFALRGIIDPNRDRVRVLYTGSSRDGLRKLFARRNAALFSSSQQIDLPTFGRAYLEYTAGVFKQATARTLDINECAKAFRTVKKVPYDFRGVIDMLITHGGTDIIAVTELYLADNSQEETYRSSWDSLKPMDRLVLQYIILHGGVGLYTTEARAHIAEQLGLDTLDTAPVQNAVNRLRRDGHIASVAQGQYELEDPYFADWIVTAAAR